MIDTPISPIPAQPVLSFSSFKQCFTQNIPSILDARHTSFVTSGRIAIVLALLQMKIGKNDKVLVPAYHCSSMIEPIIWVGATPVFYKIHPDTSIDLDDVRSKLDASTKLLMVTHYFGFPQDLPIIRSLCDQHNIFLLEDCAHAFFGTVQGNALGSVGDYAIASSMKFFPIYDGGCVISEKHRMTSLSLQTAGLAFEAKSLFNALEKSFAHRRLRLLKTLCAPPIWLKDFLLKKLKKHPSYKNRSLAPRSSDGGFGFEAAWINKRASVFSRLLMVLVGKSRITQKRRQHYLALQRMAMHLPGTRLLFPNLPDNVVPYLFPLLVDEPEKIVPQLKNKGVPVIRFGEFLWESDEARICSVSADLSRRVLQFPCHQELTPQELTWMMHAIREVVLTHGAPQQ